MWIKIFLNAGNQIHNVLSSSGSGTVINYGSGSGSDFLTSYDSGSGSTSQKVTVPTVPVLVPVPVPQHLCPLAILSYCSYENVARDYFWDFKDVTAWIQKGNLQNGLHTRIGTQLQQIPFAGNLFWDCLPWVMLSFHRNEIQMFSCGIPKARKTCKSFHRKKTNMKLSWSRNIYIQCIILYIWERTTNFLSPKWQCLVLYGRYICIICRTESC